MQYDFDRIIDRRMTESVKWHAYDEDVLPLWVADMDFVSPEPVIRALQERVEHGVFGYPSGFYLQAEGQPDLRQILVDRMAQRFGWQIEPEDLLLAPGVVSSFNQMCHAVAEPDGGVLVQTPVYPPFLSAPGNAGLQRQEMRLSLQADGSYAIDWEAFEAAIDEHTRLFILCNPHNPVGRVFRKDELERMAEICLRHGVLICSDEIHCDLTFSGHQHIPIASLDPEVARNTVTLIAPSKTYNIAGLHASIVIVQDQQLRQRFRHAGQGLVGSVNLLGLTAMIAAFQDGQEWLDQLLAYLEGNRDFLQEYVDQKLPGIHMTKPEGTYLAWLDCRETGIDNPYEFFLKEARVAMNDGKTFGSGGEGFVRLNFACPRSLLQQALDRMRAALQNR